MNELESLYVTRMPSLTALRMSRDRLGNEILGDTDEIYRGAVFAILERQVRMEHAPEGESPHGFRHYYTHEMAKHLEVCRLVQRVEQAAMRGESVVPTKEEAALLAQRGFLK